MGIEVRGITKKFVNFTALNHVSLEVKPGELVALLGPSGSGKTTLLRIIAGLEAADEGTVYFNGEDTANRSLRERRVGFVFQHYALFRHMTVFENVAFGLRVRPRKRRPPRDEINHRVHELLRLVQLDQFANRYPSQLSGGQRQRVALSRALAVEPDVLLLDEPFGALDAKVRKELRRWLRQLHDEIHVTSVFVTHDQEEALEVADRIVVMNKGQIEQVGTADDVYNHPASPFVYDFLGDVNLFHGRVEDGNFHMEHGKTPSAIATALVRPHGFDVDRSADGREHFPATVTRISPVGPVVKLELSVPWGEVINAEIPRERYLELELKPNDHVFVTLREMRVFTEDYVI